MRRRGSAAWILTPVSVSSGPRSAPESFPGGTRRAITSAELLLGGLAADAGYTAAALDEFLAAARKLAAQLLT